MIDFVFLFLHHAADAVTRDHYDRFARAGTTVPLTCDVRAPLPGAFDVRALPTSWDVRDPWRAVDTTVYRWFASPARVAARRYIIVEWDCLLVGDVRDYYDVHWDAPLVSNYVKRRGQDEWYWFAHTTLDHGVVPLAGTLCSDDALAAITAEVVARPYHDQFCEARLASAAAARGIPAAALRKEGTLHASWRGRPWPTAPGLYHPIKTLAAS